MLQIKKVEKFDMPSGCAICGTDLGGDKDPYRFTFDDKTSMITCDSCGENLCCQFSIDDIEVKQFYLVRYEKP